MKKNIPVLLVIFSLVTFLLFTFFNTESTLIENTESTLIENTESTLIENTESTLIEKY